MIQEIFFSLKFASISPLDSLPPSHWCRHGALIRQSTFDPGRLDAFPNTSIRYESSLQLDQAKRLALFIHPAEWMTERNRKKKPPDAQWVSVRFRDLMNERRVDSTHLWTGALPTFPTPPPSSARTRNRKFLQTLQKMNGQNKTF